MSSWKDVTAAAADIAGLARARVEATGLPSTSPRSPPCVPIPPPSASSSSGGVKGQNPQRVEQR
ncbi:MAG: hypothetical protein ACT4PW_11390 [Acidimicrobiia bacterium]